MLNDISMSTLFEWFSYFSEELFTYDLQKFFYGEIAVAPYNASGRYKNVRASKVYESIYGNKQLTIKSQKQQIAVWENLLGKHSNSIVKGRANTAK